MQLRPYQRQAVDSVLRHLDAHGSTLLVAPTGAGKTIMLSAAVAEHGGRALVVQHRHELLEQNRDKLCRYTGIDPAHCGLLWGERHDYKRITFTMVQTAANRLDRLEPVDLLVIDEAHRAMSPSYHKTIQRLYDLNPGMEVLGLTATPMRGDRQGLGEVFASVACQIEIGELIEGGYLVPPECFAVVLVDENGKRIDFRSVQIKRTGEYDMDEVGAIVSVYRDDIVHEWSERAGDRQSVFFCPTVSEAHAIARLLQRNGYTAAAVDGTTPAHERSQIFAGLADGSIQCLTNVFVATEGWDCPPVSCVALLRPSSYKSTMVQMIGRGLRPHPGKTDCLVLDFGQSLENHSGSLIVDPDMDDSKARVVSVKDGEHATSVIAVTGSVGHIGVGAEIVLRRFGIDCTLPTTVTEARDGELVTNALVDRNGNPYRSNGGERVAKVKDAPEPKKEAQEDADGEARVDGMERIDAVTTRAQAAERAADLFEMVWTKVNDRTFIMSVGKRKGGVCVAQSSAGWHCLTFYLGKVGETTLHSDRDDAMGAARRYVQQMIRDGKADLKHLHQMMRWQEAGRTASAGAMKVVYGEDPNHWPIFWPTMYDAFSLTWFNRVKDRLRKALRYEISRTSVPV